MSFVAKHSERKLSNDVEELCGLIPEFDTFDEEKKKEIRDQVSSGFSEAVVLAFFNPDDRLIGGRILKIVLNINLDEEIDLQPFEKNFLEKINSLRLEGKNSTLTKLASQISDSVMEYFSPTPKTTDDILAPRRRDISGNKKEEFDRAVMDYISALILSSKYSDIPVEKTKKETQESALNLYNALESDPFRKGGLGPTAINNKLDEIIKDHIMPYGLSGGVQRL